MPNPQQESSGHDAEAAALGFYYQALFGLLLLLRTDSDDACIVLEQLDDVVLTVDGRELLHQLKHSMAAVPPPVTIQSPSLWRTIKVWADALPRLSLSEATFHLVTVAGVAHSSPLEALLDPTTDREGLRAALEAEAERVRTARSSAEASGSKVPYSDKAPGCSAFLDLSQTDRLNLLRRASIQANAPHIDEIEDEVAAMLSIVPPEQRPEVAKKLIQWWDREVIYSLCGKRERIITRAELQIRVTAIISEIEQGLLFADFEAVAVPSEYQPDGMLARQISLVKGAQSDLGRAIREEWRARQQRSKWTNDNPRMRSVIGEYDRILTEHWSDKHERLREECAELDEDGKCSKGLLLLRWSHDDAPQVIRPIADEWKAAFYVRGSFQVLAINREVGWHPDYLDLLRDEQ
ncbi:MAG TPA: ABC-three component system protein [Longimicrobiales bacterium]|nr:ABC-three component system protein [Longimicrobiales bacterium]